MFGWIKAQDGLAKVKVRGCAKAEAVFTFAVAAYNLIRIPKLLAAAANRWCRPHRDCPAVDVHNVKTLIKL